MSTTFNNHDLYQSPKALNPEAVLHTLSTNPCFATLRNAQGHLLDDYEKNLVSRWLLKAIEAAEIFACEPNWIRVGEEASDLLLTLSGVPLDSNHLEPIHRSFQFSYCSPFAAQDDSTFAIAIRDETTVIGSQTWNSSLVLAQRLARKPEDFFKFHLTPRPPHSGQGNATFRVLELGSGTGVTGLAAGVILRLMLEALECPAHIELILTDYHSDVLKNLQHNYELNKHLFAHPQLTVKVEKLDWAEPQTSLVTGTFDVVLGSDLVYEEAHAYLLAKVVEIYLKKLTSRKRSQLTPSPRFHLLLPLRPTFLVESQATHEAFQSTYKPCVVNQDVEGSRSRSGSSTPIDRKQERKVVVRKVENVASLEHSVGQGCRAYQHLHIGHS